MPQQNVPERGAAGPPPSDLASLEGAELVDAVLQIVRTIPIFDIKEPVRRRQDRRKRYVEQLKRHALRIIRLGIEVLPEVRLPAACPFFSQGRRSQTPIENLLVCYDLCDSCQVEARRWLELVVRGLRGEDVRGQFLPPEVIAARIGAAATRAQIEDQRRSRVPSPLARISRKPDGTYWLDIRRADSVSSQPVEAEDRGHRSRKPARRRRGPTTKQAEAVKAIETHGGVRPAARALNVDASTVRQHRDALLAKVPDIARSVTSVRRPATKRLPTDRREQPSNSGDDDRRLD